MQNFSGSFWWKANESARDQSMHCEPLPITPWDPQFHYDSTIAVAFYTQGPLRSVADIAIGAHSPEACNVSVVGDFVPFHYAAAIIDGGTPSHGRG